MTLSIRNPRTVLVLAALLTGTACSVPPQGLARGEAIYDTCSPCHGDVGEGTQQLGAPAIAGLPQWYVETQLRNFEAGYRGAHPMDTVGIRMHSMAQALRQEGDLESVAEYVASLPPANPEPVLAGDAQAGAAVYAETCVACHGPAAEGIEALGGPPLVGQSDWYLLRQFQKFRMGWRGMNSGDMFGMTMRPNSLLYTDEAVVNAIAYVQTLN